MPLKVQNIVSVWLFFFYFDTEVNMEQNWNGRNKNFEQNKWWLIFFNVNDERELFYHVMVLHDLHLLLKDGGVDNYLFFRRVSRNCNRSCKTWYGIHFVTIPPFQKNHNHPHYLPCKSSENRVNRRLQHKVNAKCRSA